MRTRWGSVLFCIALLGAVAWLAGPGRGDKPSPAWTEVAPGVWRSPGPPAGYALVDGDAALLLDAPVSADGLRQPGVTA